MKNLSVFSRIIPIIVIVVVATAAGCESSVQHESEPGVLINGVRWAQFNVDMPGTFTANPEDNGRYYQFNRRQEWDGDVLSDLTGVDLTDYDFPAWAAENDPCPAGWRVPTWDELAHLCDVDAVKREWLYDSCVGILFTDRNTGESIFLPAANSYLDGWHNSDGTTIGCYWSSTEDTLLHFEGGYYGYANRAYNHSQSGLFQVRCTVDK